MTGTTWSEQLETNDFDFKRLVWCHEWLWYSSWQRRTTLIMSMHEVWCIFVISFCQFILISLILYSSHIVTLCRSVKEAFDICNETHNVVSFSRRGRRAVLWRPCLLWAGERERPSTSSLKQTSSSNSCTWRWSKNVFLRLLSPHFVEQGSEFNTRFLSAFHCCISQNSSWDSVNHFSLPLIANVCTGRNRILCSIFLRLYLLHFAEEGIAFSKHFSSPVVATFCTASFVILRIILASPLVNTFRRAMCDSFLQQAWDNMFLRIPSTFPRSRLMLR